MLQSRRFQWLQALQALQAWLPGGPEPQASARSSGPN